MKNKLTYLLAGMLLFSSTACDDFGDTNVNPGATTEPNIGALLTNVQSQLGSYAAMTRGALFAQYLSETQYTDASLYSIPQIAFQGEYTGALYDLENIIIQDQSQNMSAIAKILKQYIFLSITDRWGDVPYSEALQGVEFSTPRYDTQEEIYKGALQALTEAVGEFDADSPVTGDVVFSGNTDLWKRTANSIRMLAAVQLSKRYPDAGGYAATEFNAALTHPAGYIAGNDQNFQVNYPGGNFNNNWWATYNGRKDFAESETMTSLMGSLSDTRQSVFGGANELEGQPNSLLTSNIGVPYGLRRALAETFTQDNPTWARVLRGDKRTNNSSVYIITASQVALARAEAADYGWTSENMQSVYNQGISLSFEQWGLNAPPASYFTQSTVSLAAPAGTGANLKNISVQRYIATYPDGLRGWNIWRKSGYPELTPAPDATNASKEIPRRYVYDPNSEYSSNPVNVKEAYERLPGGEDSQDARIWWDQ